LFGGEKDTCVHIKAFKRLVNHLKNTKAVEMKGIGHGAFMW